MSAEWGGRRTYCERQGRSGWGVGIVGDPMFWKAPISGSVKSLRDSIFLLSLFNLKPKHHSNLLDVNWTEFRLGSNLQTLITAARTRNCGVRMRVETRPTITHCQQVNSVQRILSKGPGRVMRKKYASRRELFVM